MSRVLPQGHTRGFTRGDARGATRGTYSSSDIPPILDRMLFSLSEVGTVSIFLRISLGLCPREIPRKTQTFPPEIGRKYQSTFFLVFQAIAQSFEMVKWILIAHFKAEISYKAGNIAPKNSYFQI